jgi:hypothetical protein
VWLSCAVMGRRLLVRLERSGLGRPPESVDQRRPQVRICNRAPAMWAALSGGDSFG